MDVPLVSDVLLREEGQDEQQIVRTCKFSVSEMLFSE
jgi:hypothetical protein